MKIITLQPSSYTDQLTPNGTELTKLPYPFHVEEDGTVTRQDFWHGDPIKIVGFQDRLDVQRVSLTWREAAKDPQRAVGKYVVGVSSEGGLATYCQTAIATVTVTEIPDTTKEG